MHVLLSISEFVRKVHFDSATFNCKFQGMFFLLCSFFSLQQITSYPFQANVSLNEKARWMGFTNKMCKKHLWKSDILLEKKPTTWFLHNGNMFGNGLRSAISFASPNFQFKNAWLNKFFQFFVFVILQVLWKLRCVVYF